MPKIPVDQLMQNVLKAATVVPGFNIPYLPMMEPVVRALRDTNCFGLVMVARLEWTKFHAGGLRPIRDEYERVKDESVTRLHLDHVPVIDEDNRRVDFEADLAEAIALGYDSIMVDGSRLPFQENVDCTRRVVERAHARGVPVEAELGAVMGHEAGPLPPYEELFASGKGFTDTGGRVKWQKRKSQMATVYNSVGEGGAENKRDQEREKSKTLAARTLTNGHVGDGRFLVRG
jgi:fructose/tagatose bisphosphate aldolase